MSSSIDDLANYPSTQILPVVSRGTAAFLPTGNRKISRMAIDQEGCTDGGRLTLYNINDTCASSASRP
jgi:hypothetical protein